MHTNAYAQVNVYKHVIYYIKTGVSHGKGNPRCANCPFNLLQYTPIDRDQGCHGLHLLMEHTPLQQIHFLSHWIFFHKKMESNHIKSLTHTYQLIYAQKHKAFCIHRQAKTHTHINSYKNIFSFDWKHWFLKAYINILSKIINKYIKIFRHKTMSFTLRTDF